MWEGRFTDQVALITGGASGIGFGIAKRLGLEGCHVVLFDIDQKALEDATVSLTQQGIRASALTADITDSEQVEASVSAVVRDHGKLDVVVNSAGIIGKSSTPIVDYDLETYERVLRINLVGSFLVTKYALKPMLARGYGRILLIASIAGKEGNPGMAGYSSSKAGVIGLVKGVGKEVAESGVTVNGIAPAVIRTPMNEKTAPEQLRYMIERVPMRRLGTVEEVAALAAWIVSPEASFNTGSIFDLSGGRATY
jgi:3-oxoacyl-[acyl-carrier protein] reductase